MFCSGCGTNLTGMNGAFCPNCGTQIAPQHNPYNPHNPYGMRRVPDASGKAKASFVLGIIGLVATIVNSAIGAFMGAIGVLF
ncbi:MAG: hypothetical protein FWC77_04150 [Defluviitaleaceae bacterium]|nr:hypothetical protein [Defluviitaleaceae bacterium]